jgi:hypothetical protein
MDRDKLHVIVRDAMDALFARDAGLLANDNSEWAVAHRLAVYLEQSLPGWNIDCEFNRQGVQEDPKTREVGSLIRPDIVIHHRGHLEKEHNLLAIEMKKKDSSKDHEKIAECSSPPAGSRKFQYQYGLAISLDPLKITWFENGKIIS